MVSCLPLTNKTGRCSCEDFAADQRDGFGIGIDGEGVMGGEANQAVLGLGIDVAAWVGVATRVTQIMLMISIATT